jgi:hypothetical protein
MDPPDPEHWLSLSWILTNSVALITADVIAVCFFVIYHLMHLVAINEIYITGRGSS